MNSESSKNHNANTNWLRTLKGQATLLAQDKPVMPNSINYGLRYLESLKCTLSVQLKIYSELKDFNMQPEWILFKKKKEKKKRKKTSLLLEDWRRLWSQGRLHVKVTLIHYVVSLPFPLAVALAEYTCTLRSFINISRVACAIIRLPNFQKGKWINNKTRKLTA